MDNPAMLLEKIRNSQAFQIALRFQILGTNYLVFQRNYQETTKLLTTVQHPLTLHILWPQDTDEKTVGALQEVTRLVHNLVTSAMTLVNHTRRLIKKWYSQDEFLEEYLQEVEKCFSGNSTTGFIQDLRTYTFHFQLPIITAELKLRMGSDGKVQNAKQPIVLHKQQLHQWKGWKKGKPLLDTAGDSIILQEVIEQYFQDVGRFHKWLMKRLQEIHAEELKWLKRMMLRVEKAEKKLQGAT